MRSVLLLGALAVLLGSALPLALSRSEKHASASNYLWVRGIDTGVKTWPRWVKPIAKDEQALLMVANESTYSSTDGIEWSAAPNNADAAIRPGVSQVFFKNKFWLMGGMIDWSQFTNEVWSSTDGHAWTRVVEKAPWSPRRNALVVVFDDKLWLFSGAESSGLRDVTPRRSYRDGWQSNDGLTWRRLSTILPESDEQVVVFKNQMWLFGKTGAWASSDGVTWSQKRLGQPFNDRGGYGAVVYNDRIWIFGGIHQGHTTNEVWSTADGSVWVREANAPWFPRGGEYSVVFDGKLWIYGGKTGTDYKQADDVWYMAR